MTGRPPPVSRVRFFPAKRGLLLLSGCLGADTESGYRNPVVTLEQVRYEIAIDEAVI